MEQTNFRSAYIISILISVLTFIAAAGGLFIDNLYQDNALVTAGWYGNDLVTLLVATPLLIVALILSRRGSVRMQLVWLGMLDYTLYNFAFYLFGAAFNSFFLIYVALFALSIFAIIFGLIALDVKHIYNQFHSTRAEKWISGFMLFVACGLSAVYIVQSLGFIVTGQLPPVVVLTGHPTSVVFALDLSLVVPVLVLGAVWLWKCQPWGYVLAVIVNIKGAVYMLALTASTLAAVRAGVLQNPSQIGLWAFIGVASLFAALILLGNFQKARKAG